MSAEDLKKFTAVIKSNPQLQEKLKAVKNHDHFLELYIKLAKENGFNFSIHEVKERIKAKKNHELSMNDLEAVAAGQAEFPTICGTTCC